MLRFTSSVQHSQKTGLHEDNTCAPDYSSTCLSCKACRKRRGIRYEKRVPRQGNSEREEKLPSFDVAYSYKKLNDRGVTVLKHHRVSSGRRTPVASTVLHGTNETVHYLCWVGFSADRYDAKALSGCTELLHNTNPTKVDIDEAAFAL